MINIDNKSSIPIYQQIVDEIKEQVIKGILQGGDKLPSVREMASIITANPNTISRAYSELERQNVIETIRGRGTYVTVDYKPVMEKERLESLKGNIKKIIVEAKYMGISKKKILKIVENTYEDIDKLNKND
ncbi:MULTISPECIES: GntR family transcriptional regulator [Clostridium]|uniref:GntR family transcriptional regulator n=1 Tax=Clostridium TaxID=1485 RepID=UPI000826AE7B|nr:MULTISPECIES: GntR family transcriptional regulator [Clostridium]PJI08252.1 GntR family transcriptional regulator [Clostridium sp. CT7]